MEKLKVRYPGKAVERWHNFIVSGIQEAVLTT